MILSLIGNLFKLPGICLYFTLSMSVCTSGSNIMNGKDICTEGNPNRRGYFRYIFAKQLTKLEAHNHDSLL